MNRILDRFAISMLSSSTEAGMRQSLRSDAMSIVLDEAESEDDKGRARIKSVMDLMRQASSESGGSIVKGSMSGSAQEYRVRGCFFLSSIGVAAVARADVSRITVLTLRQRTDNLIRFEATKQIYGETLVRPEYAAALRSRALSLAVEIRANAATFAHALAVKLGDHRTADQFGAMLAGSYALTSMRTIAPDEAARWVDSQDWNEFLPSDLDKDETRALNVLLEHILRIDGPNGGMQTTSIGELIEAVYDPLTGTDTIARFKRELLRHGIRPADSHVDISSTHVEIARIYSSSTTGSTWAGKWKDQLSRISGAKTSPSVRFGKLVGRAVTLPLEAFGIDSVAQTERPTVPPEPEQIPF